eukprot:jgi/Mesvir1/12188/Mv00425-RA.2
MAAKADSLPGNVCIASSIHPRASLNASTSNPLRRQAYPKLLSRPHLRQNGLSQWNGRNGALEKLVIDSGKVSCQPAGKFREHGQGVQAQASANDKATRKSVVVIGGSGRVGSSVVSALLGSDSALDITIAGRSSERAQAAINGLGDQRQTVKFVRCDIDDPQQLKAAVAGKSLVIHTAGPFQRKPTCAVLEACISEKVPYIDVCDDVEYSKRARSLSAKAKAAGVPAITTTGIYPGVSNVIAAEIIAKGRQGSKESNTASSEPTKLQFSYYTAGSGGAGPTILATSFLLLGEPATVFDEGKKVECKAFSGGRSVDFGEIVRFRRCYLLNLPEVHSAHETLRVPSVSARFGTSPGLWNYAMGAVANLAPPGFLQDRTKVEGLVRLSDPFVRLVDKIVGEGMAIRVDVAFANGTKASGLYAHARLSKCVGHSVAAFADAVLRGETQPGVWFPEEHEAVSDRMRLLEAARKGAKVFYVNKYVHTS